MLFLLAIAYTTASRLAILIALANALLPRYLLCNGSLRCFYETVILLRRTHGDLVVPLQNFCDSSRIRRYCACLLAQSTVAPNRTIQRSHHALAQKPCQRKQRNGVWLNALINALRSGEGTSDPNLRELACTRATGTSLTRIPTVGQWHTLVVVGSRTGALSARLAAARRVDI